jgi:hypothetical protein
MASEEWYTPATEAGPAVPVAAAPLAPVYELRPLTLGEVLDRTFAVYRSRFWLFAGIASVSAALQLLLGALQVMLQHAMLSMESGVGATARQGILGLATMLVAGLTMIAFSITQGATVFALSDVYLGRSTTIAASMRSTVGHWLRYIGIAIWQWWSMLWIMLVLLIPAFILVATRITALTVLGGILMFVGMVGGIVAGFILYLRNSLAVPASVVEQLPVAASMRRSKDLAVGTKGRIFVVLLIAGVLYMVMATAQAPLIFIVTQATLQHTQVLWAQALQLAINFVGSSLVGPVAMIGLSLLYFDQRVRMEAFDLMILLGEEQPGTVVAEASFAPAMDAFAMKPAAPAPTQPVTAAEPAATEPAATETAAAEPATTDADAGRPDDATGL